MLFVMMKKITGETIRSAPHGITGSVGPRTRFPYFCPERGSRACRKRRKYDVVFMDINMSRVDGIERRPPDEVPHSEAEIGVCDAFIHYAPEGYKVDAVRFIMKDTLEAALPECMGAVLKRKQLEQGGIFLCGGEM